MFSKGLETPWRKFKNHSENQLITWSSELTEEGTGTWKDLSRGLGIARLEVFRICRVQNMNSEGQMLGDEDRD